MVTRKSWELKGKETRRPLAVSPSDLKSEIETKCLVKMFRKLKDGKCVSLSHTLQVVTDISPSPYTSPVNV